VTGAALEPLLKEVALRSLPEDHERLDVHGPAALTDLELLTILLGARSGKGGPEQAAQVLLETAPLQELAWAKVDELRAVPGVGPNRAAALAAAFELGRRSGWAPPHRGDRLLDPGRVYELLKHIAFSDQEQFHIVCLDVRGRLIKSILVAQGGLHVCPVPPRDLFRSALRVNAHSVVLVHCHPSGAISPSPDDDMLTERLRTAGELLGLVIRDHLVIGSEGYFSYVEAGRWRRM
jgi:DNA repair protein RadC